MTLNPDDLPPTLGRTQVCKMVGVSRQTLMDMVERGDFPPPLPTGTRMFLWPSSEIVAYVGPHLKAERDAKVAADKARHELQAEIAEDLMAIQRQVDRLVAKWGRPQPPVVG